MNDMSEAPTVPQTGRPVSPVFVGDRDKLFSLVSRNAVFFILTLTIYRFWGWTYLRRYFWSNTELAGEPLEYRGTPWIMLKAFLRMLGFLILVTAVAYGTPILFMESTNLMVVSAVLGAGLILWFWGFALFSRMRFLLKLTRWRGINAVMKRGAAGFATRALVCTVINFLTLFLAFPATFAYLERYKYESIMVGNRSLSADVRGWDIFVIFAKHFGLAILIGLGITLATVPVIGLLSVFIASGGDAESVKEGTMNAEALMNSPAWVAAPVAAISTFVYLANLFPIIRAGLRTRAYILSRLSLDGVDWKWDMNIAPLTSRYFRLAAWAAVGVGGLTLVGSLLISGISLQDLEWINYLGYALIIMVVLFKPWFWDYFVWKEIWQGLVFQDINQIETIRQSMDTDDTAMDGFDGADFDMAAF